MFYFDGDGDDDQNGNGQQNTGNPDDIHEEAEEISSREPTEPTQL